jgi:putative ABC transport system permease protein
MVQALTEGLVLASIGGGVGLLVTTQGLPLLLEFAPRDLPRLAEVSVDGTVLAWTVAVSLLSGMLFSTAPALVTSRSDASDALKEGARGVSHARSGVYARSLLVVVEVGLATVLLVTGGLLLRSFGALQRVAPGFDAKGLLVARLSLPASRYPDRDAVNLFCETLRSRLQPLPGVEALGVVSLAPMSGLFASVDFTVDGQPPPAAEQVPVAQYRVVSPGYMRTMDIAVLEGREFTEQDIFTSRPVVLVNQTLARRFFERGMAVGSRLRVDDNDVGPRLMEIVGVVRDIKQSGLDTAPSPEIYASMPQHHPGVTVWLRNNMFWMIRTKQDPAALVEPFRAALRDVAFDVPASSIQPMDRYLSAWMAPRRFNLQLISVFAAAALLLAASGVYAVISYSVSLRTREIGIRMALGARRRTILAQVVSRGVLLSTIGVVAGLCTALALGRFLRALLFVVSPFDIGVYASMAGLLITVSCVASYLPARRAARVDPLVALRHEGWE